MKGRDSQKSKFYAWSNKRNRFRTVSVNAAKLIIMDVVELRNLPLPSFKFHGITSSFRAPDSTIVLPENGNSSMDINTIFVLASWYINSLNPSVTDGWHGASFCKIYAEVEAYLTKVPVQEIIDSMLEAKLKVRGNVGKRVLKKQQQLKNRVDELDAAIQRGREEFEEFLQPILSELESAKLELQTFESKNGVI